MSKLLEEIAKGAKDTRNKKLIINVEFNLFFLLMPRKKCFHKTVESKNDYKT